MRWIRRQFIAGLLALLPVVITGYVLWFGFNLLDGFWQRLFVVVLGRPARGAGALLTVVLTIVAGVVATNVVGGRLIRWAESLLQRIPLVRSIYLTTRQIVDVFAGHHQSGFQRVILIEYPRRGLYTIGFLTAQGPAQVSAATGEEIWSVFVPTSPNPTSGWVVLVPSSQCRALPMSVEEAFRIIVSAGVLADRNGDRRVGGPKAAAPGLTVRTSDSS